MEQAGLGMAELVINHEIRERFGGTVKRAVLLRSDDEPGQLVVRVFVEAADDESLAGWQRAHQAGIEEFRRELSLRLPSARLLEFTYDSPGDSAGDSAGDEPGAARISVPDDGSLATEHLSGREIVTKAMELLRANYVFRDQAERAAAAIEARLEAGEYDDLDEITLNDRVTDDPQEITGDKPLRLRLGGGPGPRGEPPKRPDREKMRTMGRLDNFGIRRVERLGGNVGYIDLRRMAVPANAGPAISAAMELVAGTYALIIDMRHNGGGAPEGVVFWCSYLFDGEPTHLNDIFRADTGETRQYWALPYVPGTCYPDKPVYVLTSERTFSGGEDLCYTPLPCHTVPVTGWTERGPST